MARLGASFALASSKSASRVEVSPPNTMPHSDGRGATVAHDYCKTAALLRSATVAAAAEFVASCRDSATVASLAFNWLIMSVFLVQFLRLSTSERHFLASTSDDCVDSSFVSSD